MLSQKRIVAAEIRVEIYSKDDNKIEKTDGERELIPSGRIKGVLAKKSI